jgi:osmotically-inducible protein OsmY
MRDDILPGIPGVPISERWMHGAPDDTGNRGRGPKNYVRTDQRVFEDVCEELTRDDAVDASEMLVHVERGRVTLEGTVPTARMRELAEEIIQELPGVQSVRNQLRATRKET